MDGDTQTPFGGVRLAFMYLPLSSEAAWTANSEFKSR
jgi:hypothetical protein